MTSDDPKDADDPLEKLATRALGDMADEFREHSEGAGAHLGRTALAVAGTVEAVVTSPRFLKMGWQAVLHRVRPHLEARLAKVPPDRIKAPPMHVAGPALEALRFSYDEDELRKMFVNLLATSMDSQVATTAHPAFVEIIKQLTPDEAKILRYLGATGASLPIMDLVSITPDSPGYSVVIRNISHIGRQAGVEHKKLTQAYLDNICRLELCQMPFSLHITDDEAYAPLREDKTLSSFVDGIKKAGNRPEFQKKVLQKTEFGQLFLAACVVE